MIAETVAFDVLLHPSGASVEPDVRTVAALRPAPEDIVRCRQWFAARGVEAYDTAFGLSCSAPHRVFEALFGVTLRAPADPAESSVPEIIGCVEPPAEIADLVEQVTLTRPPEFF